MLVLFQAKRDRWTTPHADTNIAIPTVQKTQAKVKIPHTSLEVPTENEDWPDDAPQYILAHNYIRDYAPFIGNFKAT
ncbi:Aste57867_882 [Aphanomyces stellatus]|uniref:Aste57867_882 protein n=1 Tax=Aphanomyces stellatus TaxID=120398 RepID=A0A485K8U4_9STRA|nr:hypothetical protein As57867_000881 [Aphanomyces stellatus]VFT78106.1 Aste57867_882 [Aphanomyces stellatus]